MAMPTMAFTISAPAKMQRCIGQVPESGALLGDSRKPANLAKVLFGIFFGYFHAWSLAD